VRGLVKRCLGIASGGESASTHYEIIGSEAARELSTGWQETTIAQKQHAAFLPLLEEMHRGNPRADFVALAEAIRATGMSRPSIIEVGCGSGWNLEVLDCLWKEPFDYIGLDYSSAMVTLGHERYPEAPFVVGDAVRLPFKDGACDILLSGTVLMHLLCYETAIQESRRVARRWCVFHTIPLVQRRPTTIIRKLAYGSPVVEIVLNQDEFVGLLGQHKLADRRWFENVPHDYLTEIVGEAVSVKSVLCEVV